MASTSIELGAGMTVRNLQSGLTATINDPVHIAGNPLFVFVTRTIADGKSAGRSKRTHWKLDNVEIVPLAQESVVDDRQVGQPFAPNPKTPVILEQRIGRFFL